MMVMVVCYKKFLFLEGGRMGGVVVDTILEYDLSADSYSQIGTMTEASIVQAISVVQYEYYSKWCQ